MRAKKDIFGHSVSYNSQNEPFVIVSVKVAGVTFKNGRRSRQTILRRIYWKDEPYQRVDCDNCIELVPVLFEGEKAVEVFVFNKKAKEQIGYIPKSEASYFYDHHCNLYKIHSFEVHGGGEKPFGASFTAVFHALQSELEPVSPPHPAPVSKPVSASKTSSPTKPVADVSNLYYCPKCHSFYRLEKSAVNVSRCQCSGTLQKTDIDANKYSSMTRSQQAKVTRDHRKYGHSQLLNSQPGLFRSFLPIVFRILVIAVTIFFVLLLFR